MRFSRPGPTAVGTAVLIAAVAGLTVISPRFAWEAAPVDRPTLLACGLMAIAGLGFAVVARGLGRRASFSLTAVIVLGVLLRLLLIGSTPIWEDDFNRYLWDGAAVSRGLDPYVVSPLEAAGAVAPEAWRDLARDQAELLDRVNHPQFRTIYPAVAQAGFVMAWGLGGGIAELRLLFLGAEVAGLVLLLGLLRRLRLPTAWSGLYWLNPVPALMFVNAAHLDVLMVPLILGAALAMTAGRRAIGSVLIGLAAGVKLWPLLLWPLLMRAAGPSRPEVFLMAGSIAGGVFVLSMAPLIAAGLTPDAGLVAYAEGWVRNSALHPPLFEMAERLVRAAGLITRMDPERTVRVALALGGAGIAVCMASIAPRGRLEPRLSLILAAVILTLSPTQYPWYWAAILPLAALAGAWRTAAAMGMVLCVYHLGFLLDRESGLLSGLIWIEYLTLWGALVLDCRRRLCLPEAVPIGTIHAGA